MSWASQRRFFILFGIGTSAVAVIAVIAIAALYKTPSCSDNKRNQGEQGIDCGGPCQYLCSADEYAPTVLFTQAISTGDGRTDVVAAVRNPNVAVAAKDVPYVITLYGADQVLLKQVTGTLDLPPPPVATVPVYVPGVSSGSQKVARAFLAIAPSAVKWFALANDPRILPVVSNTLLGGTADAPRIDAILTNGSITTLRDVGVVVFVRDAGGQIIAASQTVLPSIPAQGTATATFTWNEAFSAVPAAIEVTPIIALP